MDGWERSGFLRILIAEDDPVSRQLLETFLRKWGYDPVVACDGAQALLGLRHSDSPRLAILDWMMPGLEGLEVVRAVRELEKDGRPPVYCILLTALNTSDAILRGFEAGADDYVTQPFNTAELRARVRVGARMLDLRTRLAARVTELEEALAQVNTLQGLLPICSYCKKIRDDRNYWTEVESYFEKVSDAEFSHGVCPDCYQTHLQPKLDEMRSANDAARERAQPEELRTPDA
jgi:CheY-like chemotaxis protein